MAVASGIAFFALGATLGARARGPPRRTRRSPPRSSGMKPRRLSVRSPADRRARARARGSSWRWNVRRCAGRRNAVAVRGSRLARLRSGRARSRAAPACTSRTERATLAWPIPGSRLRAAGIDALAGVADAAAIARIAEPVAAGPRRPAFRARRALREAIDRAVRGKRGRVPQDRRARRSARHRPGRRSGVSSRRRDARVVGLRAAPGGGGGAAVLPGARGGRARPAPPALRRSARGRRRGRAAGDRLLRAADRRGDRDLALGVDAVDRDGRATWSGGGPLPARPSRRRP